MGVYAAVPWRRRRKRRSGEEVAGLMLGKTNNNTERA